jgi:hypothetical protein
VCELFSLLNNFSNIFIMKELYTREDGPLSEREDILNHIFLELRDNDGDWYSDRNKEVVFDNVLSTGMPECESYWDIIKKQFYTYFGVFEGDTGFKIVIKNFLNVFPDADAQKDVFALMKKVTNNPLAYLFQDLPKTNDSAEIENLISCFRFKVPGVTNKERGQFSERLITFYKKWFVGTVKLWDNARLGINEDIQLITPFLISPADSDVKYFHTNLMLKYHERYVDTSVLLRGLDKKLYTNLLVGVPNLEELDNSQLFQLWYYSTLSKIENCEPVYPDCDNQLRCASLILWGEKIPRGLTPFIPSNIVPFYVDSFDFFRFLDIDKEKLWAQAITLYRKGYDWKLDIDDQEFILYYLQEINSK